MKYTLFFLLAAGLSWTACRPKPVAGERSLDCYVRYLEAESQISAEATLREARPDSAAGQPVEIPGGIRFQQTDMKVSPVQGLSYRLRFPSGYVPSPSFEWQQGGSSRRFDVPLPAISRFTFGSEPLKRSTPTRVTWQGEPLRPGETLVFLWDKLPAGPTVRWEVFVRNEQDYIEFPAVKLGELTPGDWTLYLVRRKLTRDTVADWPVAGIAEFYSKADTVRVD